MDTREMIERCRRGNALAESMLFNLHYRKMYHLSMRILQNTGDTEDVLAEAFIRVFANIRSFEYRGEGSLEKWIKTIVINEAIRFSKANRRFSFTEEPAEAGDDGFSLHDSGPIDTEQVYSIIRAMPAGYRIVFNLFAIEGYSHREIAGMLGITENTSKSQLRKARGHIIERLQKENIHGNTAF